MHIDIGKLVKLIGDNSEKVYKVIRINNGRLTLYDGNSNLTADFKHVEPITCEEVMKKW